MIAPTQSDNPLRLALLDEIAQIASLTTMRPGTVAAHHCPAGADANAAEAVTERTRCLAEKSCKTEHSPAQARQKLIRRHPIT
jgi:hypothetical protein